MARQTAESMPPERRTMARGGELGTVKASAPVILSETKGVSLRLRSG